MTEEQKNDAAPQSAQGDLHRENEAQERKGLKVPRTVWALGFVSLLMDISSEMIHALLPLFMAGPLGASAVLIGLVEGAGEGAALITKVFSGAAADRFGHRKLLVFLGYALGVLSKPVFALADSVALVFAARVSDRIGKGLRGAPRDAIVAAVTPKPLWGEAYGIRQSLDAAGAFVGPALASLFLFFWTDDLRSIFWLALIPGALCLLLILMDVEDAPEKPAAKRPAVRRWSDLAECFTVAGPAFRALLVLGILFSLARFSNAFLVLRAADSGISTAAVPLLMVGVNIVFSLACVPIGKLSDHMPAERLLALGLVFLALSDVVFAVWATPVGASLGAALWGLHLGATQGVFSKMTADAAPEDKRATAFGLFSFASGVAALAAGLVAGTIWEFVGPSATFWLGSAFAAAAFVWLLLGLHRR
ncbi:MFS transporter, partial [Sutterella wadsworthensis]|uniref:MFS transporter n=1 Tax=Sutterella wadsworthensis TaxID=40545 RepID=UPI0026702399